MMIYKLNTKGGTFNCWRQSQGKEEVVVVAGKVTRSTKKTVRDLEGLLDQALPERLK